MKVYEAVLDDSEAVELLQTDAVSENAADARVVGLAPALSNADPDVFDRLFSIDRQHLDREFEVDESSDVDVGDVAALVSGAMRVVVSSEGSPVFVRYDDGTTFFVADSEVAERFGAEEAEAADGRGVLREMEADAEAEEAMEDV